MRQPAGVAWLRTGILASCIALAVVLLPVPAPGADDRLGLDLAGESLSPYTPLAVEQAIRDPHAMRCESCHLPPDGASARPLTTGDDSILLCSGCHPDSNIHPVGIAPVGADPATLGVPLGAGAFAGKITCLTCHYIHRPAGYQRHLLRSIAAAGASRMEALCAACHGARLREKSPHGGTGGSCHLCHMNRPQPGEGIRTLAPNVQMVCNFCHNALDNRHFVELDPFTDEYLFPGGTEVDIPKLNGRFTCISCHDPHAAAGRTKLLRERYLQLAGISRKINPHWKNVMCIACHEGEPAKGAPRLKEGGDVIRLCYRCHAFKYSRSDIHPINCAPSRDVTLPEAMPLKDGRLTCATCHDSSLQEGGERAGSARKKNPKFLRGGFSNRGEFCSRCHPRRLMGKLNPHEQRDAAGKPDKVKCLFCHSSFPEGQAGWVISRQFDDDTVNDLCLLCHQQRYQDEHPQAPHFVEPSRAVGRAMESSEERIGVSFLLVGERVVCITCHDPHERAQGIGAAGTEAGNAPRRLRVGPEICAGCHMAK